MLNTVLSIFLGTLLGLGFCMLAEMFDRRVRSENDLAGILGIPVLGLIEWKAQPKRRPRLLNAFFSRRRA